MLARGSPKPLYRQLKDRLLRELEVGARQPHSQLPSEREWVKKLGVSRITVRQALMELVQQGYLYTVPGKGFFVGEKKKAHELNAFLSFTAATEARGEVPSSKVLEAKILRATVAIAHDLEIAPGAEVVRLKRLRLTSDVPIMIQESLLPHARCPGLLDRDLSTLSLFATLQDDYHLTLVRAETTIGARLGDKTERKALGLEEPGVVLVVDQLSFASDGLPVERTTSVTHPTRHPLFLRQEDGGRSLGVV
ncbi:MAG TPA: GntR family transcriptional regulator [Polyangia bacterium]|nr:GntR family transcriptional regulator [Polyangia bacterium]